jgi:hypothetical protein
MPMKMSRAGDFAIYVGIAAAIAVGLIWYSSISGPNGADLFGRWGGLTANTLILFGYIVRDSRQAWRAPLFWVLVIGLLSAHLAVFTAVLLHAREWKVLWFLAMYPIEIPIFYFARDRIVGLGPPNHRIR